MLPAGSRQPYAAAQECAMFQAHSLNANDKLLRRFYEPLVLLSVLDPTRGAHRPDLITERGLDENSKLWRNYVDQLSFVCDFEKGGDTVTAVAAQKTTEAPIFWLASNSNSREKARGHLVWILARLNRLYAASPIPRAQLQDEITTRCIDFSYDRVKIYSTWLSQAIRKVKHTTKKSMNHEDKVLYEGLEHFESLTTDFHQLCAFAHSFRKSESMRILCERHNAHSSRSIWSDIRHYIGRLGSWTKATQILILGAQKFPQRIENAQVEVIGPDGPADLPNKTHMTDLRGVVRRMLPIDQAALVEELSQVLTDADSVAQIESRFCEDYTNIKPRPHAELLVLEHFHRNGFSFVSGDKYIGCSKPSCYCCHAYTQFHPGGFTPRPCHGNLWINWAPPIPLPVVTPRNDRRGPHIRPQEHHTFQMLQKMVVPIRQDLQDQILSRRPKRKRLPDSTTGMSSVIYEIHTPRTALDYNAGELQSWSKDYSFHQFAPFKNEDSKDVGSEIAEDGAPDSCLENVDQEDYGHLSFEGHTNITHERSSTHEDNAKNDDGKAQLIEPENGSEPFSRSRRTDSSNDGDDDSDGGVLLFKGRRAIPS